MQSVTVTFTSNDTGASTFLVLGFPPIFASPTVGPTRAAIPSVFKEDRYMSLNHRIGCLGEQWRGGLWKERRYL